MADRLISADALTDEINRWRRDLIEAYDLDDVCTTCFREVYELIDSAPTIEAEPIVRCKDCKHRIVNEHYGEKGYLKLKAMCDLDTGDQFELGRNAEDDDWFCADAERKESEE